MKGDVVPNGVVFDLDAMEDLASAHNLAGAGRDFLVVIEQRPVDISGDQVGRHLRLFASRSARFRARSASSASSSALAFSNVGAEPPSRSGTQYAPSGCG